MPESFRLEKDKFSEAYQEQQWTYLCLFEFIFKGFDALDYKEHTDYEIIQSTNPDFNKAIVRVNVVKQHRQIIQVNISTEIIMYIFIWL